MTKYEKARIIGVRAEMIAQGAPTLVDPGDLIHPVDIARKEFENNKADDFLDIKRYVCL